MISFALKNLLSRPARSVLALLGLTVAIMGMVGLFSVATGIQATVNQTFSRIPGYVVMQPGAPFPLFSRIPKAWVDELQQIPGVRVVRPEVWARAQLVEGRPTFSPPRFLFGTDIPASLELQSSVYRDDIVEGRFLTPADRGTLHTVISRPIANDYKKSVGDTLRVDGFDLEIVGIYECGSLLLDVAIILDELAVRKIDGFDPLSVSSVYLEAQEGVSEETIEAAVNDKFRGRSLADWTRNQTQLVPTSSLPGGPIVRTLLSLLIQAESAVSEEAATPAPEVTVDEDVRNSKSALEIRTAAEFGGEVQKFSADLDIFLYLMTGIGVVIALLSILNTMLMSVSERLTEFGVLKANGWSSWDVMLLVGCESASLGLLGGILGCLLGWCGTLVVNVYFRDKLMLYADPQVLLTSLAFSTLLGILGGAYPAWWAVKLSPMAAIRRGSL